MSDDAIQSPPTITPLDVAKLKLDQEITQLAALLGKCEAEHEWAEEQYEKAKAELLTKLRSLHETRMKLE